MVEKKLNSLITKAQAGCKTSMWMIKAELQSTVHRYSDWNRNKISNVEQFEEACFNRIERLVSCFKPGRGLSFKKAATSEIARRAGDYRRQYPYREFEVLSLEGKVKTKTDVEKEIDLPDDLAVVDAEYLANEKIARLAADDSRKMVILTAWAYECLNDTDTATLLAQRYGGKVETYRKRIGRLRTTCQKALANAI